jgi:hypothetical protein
VRETSATQRQAAEKDLQILEKLKHTHNKPQHIFFYSAPPPKKL